MQPGSAYGGGKEKGKVGWVGGYRAVRHGLLSFYLLPTCSTGLKQRNIKKMWQSLQSHTSTPKGGCAAAVLMFGPKSSVVGGARMTEAIQQNKCNDQLSNTLEQHHYYTLTGQQDE